MYIGSIQYVSWIDPICILDRSNMYLICIQYVSINDTDLDFSQSPYGNYQEHSEMLTVALAT